MLCGFKKSEDADFVSGADGSSQDGGTRTSSQESRMTVPHRTQRPLTCVFAGAGFWVSHKTRPQKCPVKGPYAGQEFRPYEASLLAPPVNGRPLTNI